MQHCRYMEADTKLARGAINNNLQEFEITSSYINRDLDKEIGAGKISILKLSKKCPEEIGKNILWTCNGLGKHAKYTISNGNKNRVFIWIRQEEQIVQRNYWSFGKNDFSEGHNYASIKNYKYSILH